MPTARKVARTRKTTPEPVQNENPQKVVTIQVTFIVSTGRDDTRDLDTLANDLRQQMLKEGAKNVTRVQGYYLVNGRVCLKEDYDEDTKDFKPGCRPPLWATSRDEQEILKRIDQESGYDKLSRNPPGLRTAAESKRHREMLEKEKEVKRRLDTPGAAMQDFYENTERGREITREREEAMEAARRRPVVEDDDFEEIDDDQEDIESVEDDDVEEIDEDGWDVEDIDDDEKMDDILEDVTTKALATVRRKVVRKS